MGLRDDEPWMYERSEDYRVGSPKWEELKTREWYAANDTRIGGGGSSSYSHNSRQDTCSEEAVEEARRLGYDDRAPGC